MRPGAVTPIDRLVAIHEEGGKRLVVIELKQPQIHGVGLHDSDTNVLVEKRLHSQVAFDNFLVQLGTCFAGNAAKNY